MTSCLGRYQGTGLLAFFLLVAVSIGTASAQPLALEIRSAEASFDQRTNEPIVAFTLTPSSAKVFAKFTAANVGRTIDLRIDGKAVSKVVIREPILGGQGQISGKFTVEQTRDIAARLTAGTAKLEVEVAP